MVDIIIPAYNAHQTIVQALASIAIQTYRDKVNVYIINDCSDKDYSKEIRLFSDKLHIVELKTDKNSGPGVARQLGIDSSNGKYIIFLDSDDELFNYQAVELLYNAIEEDEYDIVYGNYYMEQENFYERFIPDESYMYGCLHGKIYRRELIEKNNIKFNDTRNSEDNYFNFIASYSTDKLKIMDNIVYVYRYNKNSITHDEEKEVKIQRSYLYNIIEMVKESEKRNYDTTIIKNILMNAYSYIYFVILNNPQIDYKKLYEESHDFEEYYKKYEKDITDDELFEIIASKICCNNLVRNIVLEDFKKFRSKFQGNQVK